MRSLLIRLLWLAPAILWAVIIFNLSATPNLAITDGWSDFILRKIAHVLVFATLMVLVYFGLQQTTKPVWKTDTVIKAAIISLLYAVFDELHQATVPTRNGNVVDVLIDALGIGLGAAIVGWFVWWDRVTAIPPVDLQAIKGQQQIVDLQDLHRLTDDLAQTLKGGEVVALQGDLGAGKTTFAKQLIKQLGSNKTVASPTYTIERQYPTDRGYTIYHHDWYRLDNPEDVAYLGLEDKLGQSDAIILIEWPERASHLLPDHTIYITFDHVDQQTRKITINS